MSNEIIVETGTILESLNNKVDLDGGNYKGSELEAYIHEHCVGGLVAQMELKANATLDNINPTTQAKQEIVSWGMPDYSAEVALAKDNKNITIETKGYVLFKHTSITAGSTGFVNDIEVFRAQAYASAYADTPSLMIPVDIGDTVRATSGIAKFAFYPMKGAK